MNASPILARVDPGLRAVLGAMQPLTFEAAAPHLDLPGHVRAGSAVRRWGERLVVAQDDVNALALLDEASGRVEGLVLPLGRDGRRSFGDATGNKALKMDLEACVTLPDGRLLALGSGSKEARERVVIVTPSHEARVVDGHALYAALRDRTDFAGSELNVEGAVVVEGALRLFQRGNGAPRGGLFPVDATGDLELAAFLRWLDGGPVPALARIRQYDLGEVEGVRCGFTDATALPDGRVAFVAGAEDSPDTYRDGAVLGCRFGILDGGGARVTDIVDADGSRSRWKLEGLDFRRSTEDGWELVVVADMDDTEVPARMGTLTVRDAGGSLH